MLNFQGLRSQVQSNSCCMTSSPMPIPGNESRDHPISNSRPSVSFSDDGYDSEVGSVNQTPYYLMQLRSSSSDQSQSLSPSRISFNNSPAQSTKNVIETKYDNDFSRLDQPISPLKKMLVPPNIKEIPNEIGGYELPEYSIAAIHWQFNRYPDVIPKNDLIYAPTQFKEMQLQPYYLNANKIELDVAGKTFACIATQGPMKAAFNEFWKAVVVGGHAHIFNLAMQLENNRLKCDDYWSCTKPFVIMDGDVKLGTIQKINEEVLERPKSNENQKKTKRSYCCNLPCVKQHIIKRTFEFKSESTCETREIVQYHYNNWPDHGTPDCGPFKQLLDIFDECSNEGEPVVHCSAGIGRTGMLFAVHVLRNSMKAGIEPSSEDIIKLITDMRGQRTGMVQSDDQLKLIYSCVNNYPELAEK